jgi:hypothetical protein
MRGRVGAVLIVVPPWPLVGNDTLESILEVRDELRIDVLVDGDPSSRVRHVEENRRAAHSVDRAPHLRCDVHDVAAPRRAQPDLAHAG